MSIKNTALAGLIVALVLVSGCGPKALYPPPGPGHHHGQQEGRPFRVYIYADVPPQPNQCFVDLSQATLWKSKHQTVTWVSDDNAEYKVAFVGGSPFSTDTFKVPAGGEVSSRDLTLASPVNTYYAYEIKGANDIVCKKSNDPDPGVYVK